MSSSVDCGLHVAQPHFLNTHVHDFGSARGDGNLLVSGHDQAWSVPANMAVMFDRTTLMSVLAEAPPCLPRRWELYAASTAAAGTATSHCLVARMHPLTMDRHSFRTMCARPASDCRSM